MENIIESTVNAEPVGNVEPQQPIETTTVPAQAEQVEVAEPQQESKPVQDPQTNAQYAKIRREAEQRAKDAVIAEMYGQQGITTYAQYQEAIRQQQLKEEAEKQGIDPAFYSRFNSIETELNSIKREKNLLQQEQQLSNDPKIGQLYNEWKNDVHSVADQYNVDYDTAFTILTRERLADVINSQRTKAEQEAIKGLQQNAQTTPGALSSTGAEVKPSINNMSKADFEKLIDSIKRGEISSI